MTRFVLVVIGCALATFTAQTQTPKEIGLRVWASVAENPTPSIRIQWSADTGQQVVYIWRKAKDAASFPSTPLDSVVGKGATWTDAKVSVATPYEYRLLSLIRKQSGATISQFYATGYILSGIKVPPVRRDRVLLLVDSTMSGPLKSELETLVDDLEAEGWATTTRIVARAEAFDSAKVQRVRAIIKEEARNGTPALGSIMLIGRVPVPYAGNIAPDGHVPDHQGAWPADGIYGDIDGNYTDNITTMNNTSRPVNANVPKDGKYDQSQFATDVDIPVGRVDFFDMPAFTESETELLRRYLTKNHAFRTGAWDVRIGGVIDDNFGTYGEVFAAAGWRGFGGFGGDTAVRAGDLFTDAAGPTTWLLAYGCGAGSDASASGVGTTADFASKPVHAVFSFLFGSYFGDWNTRNNILRAAIASQPRVLTSAWSGRPHWYIHHMALGESIGYSTRISQNNRTIVGNQLGNYLPNIFVQTSGNAISSVGDRQIHIALLGDPTLRAWMNPIPAVRSLVSRIEPENVKALSWTAPAERVDGYDVYRKVGVSGTWRQLTARPITSTTFADTLRYDGDVQYMVRCCTLRSSASGSWYDAGKGEITALTTVGVHDERGVASAQLDVAPNPASAWCRISVTTPTSTSLTIELVDVTGTTMYASSESDVAPGTHMQRIPVQHLASGYYIVRVTTINGVTSQTLQIVR